MGLLKILSPFLIGAAIFVHDFVSADDQVELIFEKDKDVRCLIKTPSGEDLTINSPVLEIKERKLLLNKPASISEIEDETVLVKKESCTHLDIREIDGEFYEVTVSRVVKESEGAEKQDNDELVQTKMQEPQKTQENITEKQSKETPPKSKYNESSEDKTLNEGFEDTLIAKIVKVILANPRIAVLLVISLIGFAFFLSLFRKTNRGKS